MYHTEIRWGNVAIFVPRRFDCGFCGARVASNSGYLGGFSTPEPQQTFVYICPHCSRLTFFDPDDDRQWPAPLPGNTVEHLPVGIDRLYMESRLAWSAGAPTAAVMACRKVLMNVAVDQGADGDQSFVRYVDWLEGRHYIPPGGRGWVERIKQVGNEANHEIPDIDTERAKQILSFTEGLLRFIYELPVEGGGIDSQEQRGDAHAG